jgi:hypothetical protein
MSKPAEIVEKVETYVWSDNVVCHNCSERSVLITEIPVDQDSPEWPQKCSNCDGEYLVHVDDA